MESNAGVLIHQMEAGQFCLKAGSSKLSESHSLSLTFNGGRLVRTVLTGPSEKCQSRQTGRMQRVEALGLSEVAHERRIWANDAGLRDVWGRTASDAGHVEGSKRRRSRRTRTVNARAASQLAHTEPATGSDTPTPSRPSDAERSRTLMEVCGEGTLATASPDGWPLATVVRYALDVEGRPVLKVEPSRSSREGGGVDASVIHLEEGACCSLHVQVVLPGGQKPQCVLKGRWYRSKDEDEAGRKKLQTAWQRHLGKMEEDEETAALPLSWIEVEDAYVTADIGEEVARVPGSLYASATADPLRECAGKIVEDMNREHWEDIRLMCEIFAGVVEKVEEASMIWVDRFGFDLRVLTEGTGYNSDGSPNLLLRDIRVPFTRALVTDERDARSSLTMMAQMAWEAKRKYIPPTNILLSETRQPQPAA
eukprot:TRINITY_DN4399_c0_g2_i1.p1 TRINITY_DN4399_c0_g2~~TRINITY_DN4399_c0_g2_i1.p1  ORF type:complete len:423 (-),score=64.08 TRINITY_DN4399_c0_g2_i1:369-1637(-)